MVDRKVQSCLKRAIKIKAVFNIDDSEKTVILPVLSIETSARSLKNLWNKSAIFIAGENPSVVIPAHGAVLFAIQK